MEDRRGGYIGGGGHKEGVSYPNRPWEEIMGDTIVLNKPVGFVSGQEEHQHVPAVRLLNRRNMHLTGVGDFDDDDRRAFEEEDVLHFDEWKFSGYNMKSNSIPKRTREALDEDESRDDEEYRPPTARWRRGSRDVVGVRTCGQARYRFDGRDTIHARGHHGT